MKKEFPCPLKAVRGRLACLTCAASLLACGCQRVEEISQYTVPKPPSESPSPHQQAAHPSTTRQVAPATGPQRMLAAMMQDGDRVWFFKVMGPADLVAETKDEFLTLLDSATLAESEQSLTWDLPEGWLQEPPSGMRYATIDIPTSNGMLELSVTPLKSFGEYQEYVFANVNRWRQQLGLAPTTLDQLFNPDSPPGDLEEIERQDAPPILFVDLTGDPGTDTSSRLAGSMGLPPMGPAAGGPSSSMAAAPQDAPGLTYDQPAHWVPGQSDGMRRAAFEIRDGSRVAELTVIPLAAGSGDLLSNVNRWRDQIGLGPLDAETLRGQLQELPVHDAKGRYVELTGPPEALNRESILGVICTRGDQTWFFKMKGDAEMVDEERDSFRAFVRSVKFAEEDGADHAP